MSIIVPLLISWLVATVLAVALCWALSGHKAFSFFVGYALVAVYWLLNWAYAHPMIDVSYHLESLF
ncbi:hypothetical protein AH156_19965 [Salmonella enterica subsp. enterica serovar Enteritidis]|nr:hypothetical protein [Salmonella enterica subsp. enterica serovar Enteritidis]